MAISSTSQYDVQRTMPTPKPRSTYDTPITPVSYSQKSATITEDDGVNHPVPRKKLPWLDNPRKKTQIAVDGRSEFTEPTKSTAVHEIKPGSTRPDGRVPLDPVNSRDKPKPMIKTSHAPRTVSHMPGEWPTNENDDVKEVRKTDSSSEYSTTLLAVDNDVHPHEPQVRNNSVHISKGKAEPLQLMHAWLQHENDLPLDDDISPSDTAPEQSTDVTKTKAKSSGDVSRHKQSPDVELRDMSRRNTGSAGERARSAFDPSWSVMAAPWARKTTTTLHNLPDHLMSSSSSTSQEPSSLEGQIQSPGRRGSMESPNGGIHRALTGFENLMEEAVNVAQEAAKSGHSSEAAHILSHAALALDDAGSVGNEMKNPVMVQQSSVPSSESACNTETSTHLGVQASVKSAPTVSEKAGKSSRRPTVDETARAYHTRTSRSQFRERSEKRTVPSNPQRLHQPEPAAHPTIQDFAYRRSVTHGSEVVSDPQYPQYGEAAVYYGDQGQSVNAQPGVRKSMVPSSPLPHKKSSPAMLLYSAKAGHERPPSDDGRRRTKQIRSDHAGSDKEATSRQHHQTEHTRQISLQELEPVPIDIPERTTTYPTRLAHPIHHSWHLFHKAKSHDTSPRSGLTRNDTIDSGHVAALSSRVKDDTDDDPYQHERGLAHDRRISQASGQSGDGYTSALEASNLGLKHPRANHVNLDEGQAFSLGRYHKRRPIAREWNRMRKRLTALIACLNTIFVGFIAGIYVRCGHSAARTLQEMSDVLRRLVKYPEYNTSSPTNRIGS